MLFDLMKNVEYKVVQGDNTKITGITMDSRKIEEGYLFVCIEGLHVDSHKFIDIAVNQGAAAVLVQKNVQVENENLTIIKVDNTRSALSYIASNYYDNPEKKLNLIGITGTNGKTSTAFFVENILREHKRNTGMIGTVDTRVNGKSLEFEFLTSTTPDSIELMEIFDIMSKSCEDVVMEVSSHALDLHKVEGIEFQVGLFTNLTSEHLDFHLTLENYFNAKAKLFSQSKNKVINIDDPYGKKLADNFQNDVYTFGIKSDCDYQATNVVYSDEKVTYDVVIDNKKHKFVVNIPGEFTVYNTLGAIVTCLVAEVPVEIIKIALENTKGVPGRIQKVENDKGINVFVDYAHTPDSLENIIRAIRQFTKGRVITIFGCGGDRDSSKREMMAEISGKFSDFSIVTSDNPRTEDPKAIIEDVLVGFKEIEKEKYTVIEDRKKAIYHAVAIAKPNDSIIIAGKGHETYQIFADQTIHFDDAEVSKEALEGSK